MASTPSIQFGGVVSGLDTSSIISALMQQYEQPLTQLQNQATQLKAEQAAYTTVQSALNDMLTKVQAFTTVGTGAARSGTSSDPSVLSATVANGTATGQYSIDVSQLATATVARSTSALGTPITQAIADGTQSISSLNLPGSVTAGQFSVVVDGQVASVSVDPTQDLSSVLNGIGSAITSLMQGEGDAGATATASVVNNRVQIAISGATSAHAISFGSGGDTSNAASILGLSTLSSDTLNPTLTATSLLGVSQATQPLDAASIAGLSATPMTGTLTINGVAISYDTSSDSLSSLADKINSAGAGVVASLDRTNDQLVLTSIATGPTAISISDSNGTSGLAEALGLAPGTANAETIGQAAQLSVNGQPISSASNTVTNAVNGVTLSLTGTGSTTLNVGVDTSAIAGALNDFVSSFNALTGSLNTLTQVTPGTPGQPGAEGPLANDYQTSSLALTLNGLLTQTVPGLPAGLNSLASIGITTGAPGQPVGSTYQLSLDQTTLQQALTTNPQGVAQLLDSATGALQPLLSNLQSLTDPATGYFATTQTDISSQLTEIQQEESDQQAQDALYQQMLETKYANMESLLAQLQTESQSLTGMTAAFTNGSSTSSSSSSSGSSGSFGGSSSSSSSTGG